MNKQNRQVNLGYALITFSHADEAKKAMLLSNGEMIMDNHFVTLIAKDPKIDHSELDRSYFMRKMKNEAELVDQAAELREAKNHLRDFERNFDNEIPSLKRLAEFKALAQDIIEDKAHRTRRHGALRRNKRETEELYEKLRAYQAKNPSVDITTLFESYEADRARL